MSLKRTGSDFVDFIDNRVSRQSMRLCRLLIDTWPSEEFTPKMVKEAFNTEKTIDCGGKRSYGDTAGPITRFGESHIRWLLLNGYIEEVVTGLYVVTHRAFAQAEISDKRYQKRRKDDGLVLLYED